MATTKRHSEPAPRPRQSARDKAPTKDTLALEKDLMELARTVPESEWAKLPKDLNENLDHYLYGSPKRTPSRPPRS